MKPTTREILENLKNNNLPNTEGIEDALTKAAMEVADRQKWSSMLAEEGIERDKMPMQVAQTGLKVQKNTRWIMGIAASLLLVASVVWLMRPSESAFSVDNYLTENRFATPETRKGNADPNQVWQQAKQAYGQNNYAEVLRLMRTQTQMTDEQMFYVSLSSLYQNDARQAAGVFDILESKGGDFSEEARWYAALSYLKLGNKTEAKARLEKIIGQKSWNHALASEVLKTL